MAKAIKKKTRKKVSLKSASDTARTLANFRWQLKPPKYKSWREGGFMRNPNRGIVSNRRLMKANRKK